MSTASRSCCARVEPMPWPASKSTRSRIGLPDEVALCAHAKVVIVRAAVAAPPPACKGVVLLTAKDFTAGGAAELYRRGDGWSVVWAQPIRGVRPWTAPEGPEE